MMRALLVDCFKMIYHTANCAVSTYSLVSSKPKMKKADPASRTSFKNGAAPPGSIDDHLPEHDDGAVRRAAAEHVTGASPTFAFLSVKKRHRTGSRSIIVV
jgi:uncharacterized protein (TIGR03435 family)